MKRLLVLASGRGSNLKAILEATRTGTLRAKVIGAGVSKVCEALQVIEGNGLKAMIAPSEAEILQFVLNEKIDAVVLAGYMKVISPSLIEALRDEKGLSRILNIHPSLLPSFPGLDAYQQAFNAGVRESGITVHLVEKEIDSGPILDQKSFRIDQLKSPEEVQARGLQVEHALYPQTIDWFVHGEYRAEKREGAIYVARLH